MLSKNSGNDSIASWMSAPATQHLLEFVRPDFLMLRTIAKGYFPDKHFRYKSSLKMPFKVLCSGATSSPLLSGWNRTCQTQSGQENNIF